MLFGAARERLAHAVEVRATPGAVVEVGRTRGPIWQHAVGRMSYESGADAADVTTVYDLASLTKVLATAPLMMAHIVGGRLSIDDRLAALAPGWNAGAKANITVRHLLDHSSGLPAHRPYWRQAQGRAAYEACIRAEGLEREPGEASVYSDLGFMLLGFLIEDAGERPLSEQFDALALNLGMEARFCPPSSWRSRTAPTEHDPWRGRVLLGEVHDENAAALGGVAGHAGLFGTVSDVGAMARAVLGNYGTDGPLGPASLMRLFATKTGVPASSRALAWDTMLPTSSCGTRFSEAAIGHTGFTGTSLWIDPARDLYVALLSNRVHPHRENQAWARLRPQIHDAILDDLD